MIESEKRIKQELKAQGIATAKVNELVRQRGQKVNTERYKNTLLDQKRKSNE